MEVGRAVELTLKALEAGTSCGYLVVGDLSGSAREFADELLSKLYPEAELQVVALTHPDIVWLESEGKSRTIHTETLRERLLKPLSVTSFSGGWKTGVVVGADRFEVNAANAFLKLLEEPPPKTLLLLLTDAPDEVLPTVVSRCRRLELKLTPGLLGEAERSEVRQLLFGKPIKTFGDKAGVARGLAALLERLEDEAEETEVAAVRKAFYRTLAAELRQKFLAGQLPLHAAARNYEAIEEAFRRTNKSMKAEAVLSFMFERLVV